MVLHSNSGAVLVTMKGDLKGYGTVWYHPTGIANILSLNNVRKKYQVTFDSGSTEEQGFVELIRNKAKWTLMTSIHQVVGAYHASGFRICNILADRGFECIRNNLADIG